MAIIKCPECGHQVSDQAKTCPSCGIDIAGNVIKCPECGEIIFSNQEMCPGCHHPLHSAPPHRKPEADMMAEDGESVVDGNKSQPENKNKKKYTAFAIAIVTVLIGAFVFIYFYTSVQQRNELDAYENAMTSGEPAVLQNFLDMYGDAPSEHIDSVTARLTQLKEMDLEWNNAVVSGSKTELEKYIRLHPDSKHETEAKMLIDSIDWKNATDSDTPEAYQTYMENHGDGLHIDEARDRFNKLDAQKVTDEERQLINRLFATFFNALATGDDNALTATLSPVLTSFLHKENATKSDVIRYMDKLHEPEDIISITYLLNDDWKIGKRETDGGDYEYTITFSVDQKTDRTDKTKETFCTYKVIAKVSVDSKISELNMQRIVQ